MDSGVASASVGTDSDILVCSVDTLTLSRGWERGNRRAARSGSTRPKAAWYPQPSHETPCLHFPGRIGRCRRRRLGFDDEVPLLRQFVLRLRLPLRSLWKTPASGRRRGLRILRQFVLRLRLPLQPRRPTQARRRRCQMHLVRQHLLWKRLPLQPRRQTRTLTNRSSAGAYPGRQSRQSRRRRAPRRARCRSRRRCRGPCS